MTAPRPVLLLSGWGTGEDAWDDVLPLLGGEHVIALPWHEGGDGAGGTGRVGEALSSRPGPWVLAGWSLGALLALAAALEHPSPVASLVLVSATARLCADGEYPGADPGRLRAMRRALPSAPEGVLAAFADLCARPDGGEAARERFLSGARPEPAERLARGLDILARADLRSRAVEVRRPVLLLHGTEDAVVPEGSARVLAGLLPSARLRLLPGRGHALPWTAPEAVAGALREARTP